MSISLALRDFKGVLIEALELTDGAEGGTRTRTGSLPLPPQDSVSTSSTTTAKSIILTTTG